MKQATMNPKGIPHDTPMKCPTCNASGHFDANMSAYWSGPMPAMIPNAVWHSKRHGWECYDCWLKR